MLLKLKKIWKKYKFIIFGGLLLWIFYANKKIEQIGRERASTFNIIQKKETQQQRVSVTDTSPRDGVRGINTARVINIDFAGKITSEEKDSIYIGVSPNTEVKTGWKDDYTLIVTPKTELLTDTEYKVTVHFEGELIYSFANN